MSVYDLTGSELQSLYSSSGEGLTYGYDISGTEIFDAGGSSDSDYDIYNTEYQHTILIARNAWSEEYRSGDDVIPVVLHTDQHGYLNDAHKSTFDYLALAIKWNEVSAMLNLGDVTNSFSTDRFQRMQTVLGNIPSNKRINLWGNHETWTSDWYNNTAVPTDDDWSVLKSYFNNSNYNGYVFMSGTKCSQYMIDAEHHLKYVIIGGWDYDASLGGHSHYVIDTDNMDSIISMLSVVDDNDIVILSHIQPYVLELTDYKPAVDGSEASSETARFAYGTISFNVGLDNLYADRKAKRSGTITDAYGVVHNYDFSNCTSDLICTFIGHEHRDRYRYSPDGTVPAIVFDAYRYDNSPLYMVNINRTKQWVNVWKFDEVNNIYNYQVPFTEPSTS